MSNILNLSCQYYQSAKVEVPHFDGKVVDLRSDTLTLPTGLMRQAMAEAVVGDDVFGEDPTVKSLECRVADMLGKEAGLYIPSGTMSNLLAVMTHCRERGSEMFLGDKSHIYLYEQGGSAFLAGVHANPLPNLPDGTFDLDLMKSRVRADDPHLPMSKLICIENSHNYCGGKALPLDWLEELSTVSKNLSLPVHIDGARLLNSAIYHNVPVAALADLADSISLCLSKGIGAPVGSVLVGTKDFIKIARRYRKAVGGGMRQAGVLAAAAHVALDGAVERMIADHENAKIIVEAISQMRSDKVVSDPSMLHTNIILITTTNGISADEFLNRLEKVSDEEVSTLKSKTIVRGMAMAPHLVRLVMNGNVSRQDTEMAAEKIKLVISQLEEC